MSTRIVAALLPVLLALPPAARGQDSFKPKKSKIPDADIDRAVERGVDWLKQHAKEDPTGNHGATTEELVFYTLLHGGVAKDDPLFQELLKRIVDKDPQRTYSVALAAMALSQLDKSGYRWKLEQFAQFFMDNQCENGQWSYGEPVTFERKNLTPTAAAPSPSMISTGPGAGAPAPKLAPPVAVAGLYGARVPAAAAGRSSSTQALPRVRIRQRRRGPPEGDNSNSMYAALGLRACAEAGIEPDPRCVEEACKWWEKAQHGDGGWGYRAKDEGGEWGGMSMGGAGSLCIYDWFLRRPWKDDARIGRGFQWLNDTWAVDHNPQGKENDKAHWHYYYLYGLERAAMMFGADFVGSHDWYDEGAAFLLKQQGPDGSWKGDGAKSRVWDTCFAILFLRRATKPLPGKVFTGN